MALCGCTLKGDRCGLWGLGTIMECSLNGWCRLINTMKVWSRIDLQACNWGWKTPIKQVGTTQTCNQLKRSSTKLSHRKVRDWQENGATELGGFWTEPTCIIRPDNLCPGAIRYGVMEGMVFWLLFLRDGGRSPEDRHSLKISSRNCSSFVPSFNTVCSSSLEWSSVF